MDENKLIIKSWRVMTICILTSTILLTGCGEGRNKSTEEGCEGIQLLAKLEEGNIGELEKKLEEHLGGCTLAEDEAAKVKDEAGAANEAEDMDIYSKDYNRIFEDTIFMGDSITEGLYYMNVIDKSKVVASMGASILKAKEELTTVVSLVPKKVVLLYGMNDVILFNESNEWTTVDSFKANYKELLQTLKNQLPYAEIYVQSPLSVDEARIKDNPRLTNENIDRFRAAVEEVCEEVNVNYVNANSILEKDESLRADDGIHLNYDFYIQWLSLIEKSMN
ncbi:MAG: GDSL-type esterase/lipase family protein [Clostridium sp.]|nr:GDSL-type esterase/lipase family protein [Clostridium sp.]MDU7084307.1 GDSL-type esterase/lipase family protein [Clostridium sp.]